MKTFGANEVVEFEEKENAICEEDVLFLSEDETINYLVHSLLVLPCHC